MPVKKIAITNPYLQGGHREIAETESAIRYAKAGANLAIDVRMFANSDDVYDFDPDLIVAITYQEGKLTKYPTYVSLNAPAGIIKDEPRFVRNILSCDGFLTISDSVSKWLIELCAKHNKPAYIGNSAFSVPKTEFVPLDFSRVTAMYMGTNWDGMRHQDLFRILADGKYLKCYGPHASWRNYPTSLYGGGVAFDGESVFKKYRSHGAGLCIGHPQFDEEGIANNRLFEIPAASVVAICSSNELTRKIYGDSVLYIDHRAATKDLAEEIIASIEWVRGNPKLAQEMVREAHDIYNNQLSMEKHIISLVELHETVMKERYSKEEYVKSAKKETVQKTTVVYICSLKNNNLTTMLSNIRCQSYQDIKILLLCEDESHVKDILDFPYPLEKLIYHGVKDNVYLIQKLEAMGADWIGILTDQVDLYAHHTSTLINYAKNRDLLAVCGNVIEFSNLYYLPDCINDNHNIRVQNKRRIIDASVLFDIPIPCFLTRFTSKCKTILTNTNMCFTLDQVFIRELDRAGKLVMASDITSTINVDQKIINDTPMRKMNEIVRVNESMDSASLIRVITKLQRQIEDKDHQINAIYTSRFWFYTAPIRKMISGVKLMIGRIKVLI